MGMKTNSWNIGRLERFANRISMFFNQSGNLSTNILACVAGGIVCTKFEPRSREGNGEKQFEIPPAGSFVSSRAPADRRFGLVESCEHVKQMLEDLSISPKGNLRSIILAYIESEH